MIYLILFVLAESNAARIVFGFSGPFIGKDFLLMLEKSVSTFTGKDFASLSRLEKTNKLEKIKTKKTNKIK